MDKNTGLFQWYLHNYVNPESFIVTCVSVWVVDLGFYFKCWIRHFWNTKQIFQPTNTNIAALLKLKCNRDSRYEDVWWWLKYFFYSSLIHCVLSNNCEFHLCCGFLSVTVTSIGMWVSASLNNLDPIVLCQKCLQRFFSHQIKIVKTIWEVSRIDCSYFSFLQI